MRIFGATFAVVIATFGLVLAPASPAQAVTRPVPPPLRVEITAAGFVPAAVTLAVGQGAIFDNETVASQTVTEPNNAFDSGPIPPGGRFVMSIGTPAHYSFSSTPTPAFTGVITVGSLVLPGLPTDFVANTLPDITPAADPTPDVDPKFGIMASRTRALVSFVPRTTVNDANQALADAGVTIVGSYHDFGVVVVEVPDTGVSGDFANLLAALASLRANSLVNGASYEVHMNSESDVPQPTPTDPGTGVDGHGTGSMSYSWDDVRNSAKEPIGTGGNWGLEASRFPQAWNLLDSIVETGGGGYGASGPQTVVLDGGFDLSHPDLQNVSLIDDLCPPLTPGVCNPNPTGVKKTHHGTATAGIIGAAYDAGGTGISAHRTTGANPAARLVAVPYRDVRPTPDAALGGEFSVSDLLTDVKTILGERTNRLKRLRVISASLGEILHYRQKVTIGGVEVTRYTKWESYASGRLCGPGLNDDSTAAATFACTPAIDDAYLAEIAQISKNYEGLALTLANDNVLWVQAAGNEGTDYCIPFGVSPYYPPACGYVHMPTYAMAGGFGWLATHWTSPTANPIMMVEAYSAKSDASVPGSDTPARDDYSNILGLVTGPGQGNLAPAPGGGFQFFNGTSAATPYVAALAGYLSSLSPGLSYSDLARLIVRGARPGVTDTKAPRIDAYTSVLATPGAEKRLVDMSDASPDGDRRMIVPPGGGNPVPDTIENDGTGTARFTAPDNKVDMRDLRRFRDAWLQSCKGDPSGTGCPAAAKIQLDGDATNPKFDLNNDGCVHGATPNCPLPETSFSRFDFNGDGKISLDLAPVPLALDGTVLAAGTSSQSDLDMLSSQWTGGPSAQGWTKVDLGSLMDSADINVLTGQLFAAGAPSVSMQVLYANGTKKTAATTITDPNDARITTVPLDLTVVGGDNAQVQFTYTIGGVTHHAQQRANGLKAGEDRFVAACDGQVKVSAGPTSLRLNSGQTSTITATLADEDCAHGSANGGPAHFEIVGDAHGATLQNAQANFDADGKATVELTAGTTEGPVVVRASAANALDGNAFVSSDITVQQYRALTVYYKWRQTTLAYNRVSSNDFGAGRDDCDGSNNPVDPLHRFECFSNTQVLDTQPPLESHQYVLDRTGSIEFNGVKPVLTEREFDAGTDGFHNTFRVQNSEDYWHAGQAKNHNNVDTAGAISYNQHWDGTPLHDAAHDGYYEKYPLQSVGLLGTGDGVEVTHLNEIAELPYPYSGGISGGTLQLDGPWSPNWPTELALLPRGDGSALQYGPDTSAPMKFTRDATGFQPYSYCGVVDKNLADPGGYWSETDPMHIWGRGADEHHATRQPGDHTAPMQSGEWKARMQFVAVIAPEGQTVPDSALALPDCVKTNPEVNISYSPSPAIEGQPTQFNDFSDFEGSQIGQTWTFGDGSLTSNARNPLHTFSDNGTYPVTLALTDAGGEPHQATVDVPVQNAPPSISISGVDVGQLSPDAPYGATVHATIDDPGPTDALGLVVTAVPTNPSVPRPDPVTHAAGALDVPVPNLKPGDYAIVVTVTDKDGATASASVQVAVPALPPPAKGAAKAAAPRAATRTDALASALSSATGTARATTLATTLATETPSTPAPIAGFVVSDAAPTTAAPITIRNASRDSSGALVDAIFDAGDGRAPITLGPSASASISYLAAGPFEMSIAQTGADPLTSTTTVTVTGASVTPLLTYTGVTSGAVGLPAAVRAHVTKSGGAPLVGREVHFTLGSVTAIAATDASGVATSSLVVPAPAGAQTLHVDAIATGGTDGVTTNVAFNVIANSPPSVDTGGPYTAVINADLALHATGSDPDPGETAGLAYAWDLNRDGQFDDGTFAQLTVRWTDLQAAMCAGVCDPGTAHDIAVRVTDAKGATATAHTTVTFGRDFGVAMSPSSALLNPGGSTSFLITVTTQSGFDTPVALTAPGLPAGVTASFIPALVVPGRTSVLTLTAAQTATAQSFPLQVTATSGAISHTTGSSLELDFGLVPRCFGHFVGNVTDADTGLALANARIGIGFNGPSVQADANGHFDSAVVPLGNGNAAQVLQVVSQATNYYDGLTSQTSACKVTTTFDIAMHLKHFASISGHVFGIDHEGGPQTPLVGALVQGPGFAPKSQAPDGAYHADQIAVGQDNAPITYFFGSSAPGYFPESKTAQFVADQTTNLDWVLFKQCFASALVRVLDATTNRPVAGAFTQIGNQSATTDAGGIARITGIGLSPGNKPATYTVYVQGPPPEPRPTNSGTVAVNTCNSTVPLDITLQQPVAFTTTVDATVTDVETGLPIAGVTVGGNTSQRGTFTAPTATDAAGHVQWTFRVGYDLGATTLNGAIGTSFLPGYFGAPSQAVTLTNGGVTEVHLTMLRHKTASLSGVVRDIETGKALPGVVVFALGSGQDEVTTGPDGHYRIDNIPLGTNNGPTSVLLQAGGTGLYWGKTISTPIDAAPNTQDIDLVRICVGPVVRGRVFNAETQQPLPGATVFDSYGQEHETTDAEGRFALTKLFPGDQNAPYRLVITAAKSGFLSADKTVNLFCGADVILDFARAEVGFGAVTGRVTDGTGQPVAGLFVGSGFGGAATTDSDGHYTIANAPLADNGGDRAWDITVQPAATSPFKPVTQPATVKLGQTTTLDFVLTTSPTTTTTTTTTTSVPSTTTTTTTTTTVPPTTTTTSTTTTSTTTTSTTTTTVPPTTTSTSTTTVPATTTTTSTTTAPPTTTSTTTVPPTTTTTSVEPTTTTTVVETGSTTSSSTSSTISTSTSTSTTIVGATTSTTAQPETVQGATTSTTAAPAGTTGPQAVGGSDLPFTGSNSQRGLGFALLVLVLGSVALAVSRKRHG